MRHKDPVHVGFDMTPMIDVTFNLLVFFLLVSEFTKAKIVRLELPEPAKELVKPEPNPSRVIINVTDINGAISEISCDGRVWPQERFGDLLRQLKALKGTGLEIELRADKRLKWSMVADLMLACAQESIQKINFVAKR
jgi:biopolymer transport protein ExbD